jgi:serine O-acetyltransferase
VVSGGAQLGGEPRLPVFGTRTLPTVQDEEAHLVIVRPMPGLGTLRRVAGEIRRDVAAAHDRDPAARGVSSVEILTSWPGVHALLSYRVAHAMHHAGVPFVPRLLSTVTRAVTGIEIHPAAQIGDGLFIDHGTGVVVGETAEIGNDVTLYQGVTLGGTGFATGKRHPTVQDNVTIGSGAKLLGPITVGHGAKIGANSVVITDVPPNSTVVGNPGHVVRVDGRKVEGPDADWIHLPDPVADAIKGLAARIEALERAVAEVAGREADPVAEVRPLRPAQGRNPAGG